MSYDLVIINGDSFSEGNGLCRQFEKLGEECKHYENWLQLKKISESEVFLDRSFSWGTIFLMLAQLRIMTRFLSIKWVMNIGDSFIQTHKNF